MIPELSHYKAYILRLWLVEREEHAALVASIEDCETNQRKAFASLQAMLDYLEHTMLQGILEDSQDKDDTNPEKDSK